MIIEDRNLGRDVSGHVVFTTSCHLIAPCVVAPGSLTVTSEALFFAVDEENPEYQKLDPKVCVVLFEPLTAFIVKIFSVCSLLFSSYYVWISGNRPKVTILNL